MKVARSALKLSVRLFLGCAAVLLVAANHAAASNGPAGGMLKAGAAASNITPPLDLPIVGGFHPVPGTYIHDELYAKCIVLDDGSTRLVFVVADVISIPRETCDVAKELIRQHTGIPPENVLIAGTHTHSSVRVGKLKEVPRGNWPSSYAAFLAVRISDAVRRAVHHLEPARIGRGSVDVPDQVFNRRYFMKPGTPTPNPFGGVDRVVMNPGRGNPNILKAAGPTDPEIAFFSIQAADGRPIALLANYSLHYVGPAAGPVYSADYFGVFADRIQQLLGADRLDPPFVGIMSNGASGDINNINWLKKPERRWGPYQKMRYVAERCAQAVYEAHQRIQFRDHVTLAALAEDLTLAVRKPTEEQLAYAKKVLAKPKDAKPYHRLERIYAKRVLQLQTWPDEVAVPLQAFRIGPWGVCAIPFEVFAETGLKIKAQSPLGPTFVISHANGSYGYLPTAEQHKLGGYETWLSTNKVEINAEAKIVARLLAMLDRLKATQR